MPVETYHGVVRGGMIVLEEAAALPDGTTVLVTSVEPQRGTAAAILAAAKAEPHLTQEDVDELERAIEQGRRPLSRIEPFPAEHDSAETE